MFQGNKQVLSDWLQKPLDQDEVDSSHCRAAAVAAAAKTAAAAETAETAIAVAAVFRICLSVAPTHRSKKNTRNCDLTEAEANVIKKFWRNSDKI